VFVAVMTFHHWAWNKVHLEMHKPKQRVFSTWRIYKFLARHHCLHHRHMDRTSMLCFLSLIMFLALSVRVNEADRPYIERWGL
jgi:hypothetical protein